MDGIQATASQPTEKPATVYYEEAFPELPISSGPVETKKKKSKSSLSHIGHSDATRICFDIPNTERRVLNQGSASGRKDPIGDIKKQFGVEIYTNSGKSNALTVIISGPPAKVNDAKSAVLREFQTQSHVQVSVPSKYHRFLIGRGGDNLKNLERETATRINVPSHSSHESDVVTITGPKQGCEAAKRRILQIVEVQSKLASERFVVPKKYHPWIRGPRQSNVNKWTSQYKVKIDMAPPPVPAEDINVSGERKAVEQVVREIQELHARLEATCQTMEIKVTRPQHRLVFGANGSGLADILEATDVSVELPTSEDSEKIVLRGSLTQIPKAMSMVYERASSSVHLELDAPNRFHKIIIGRNGAALANLLGPFQERVRVEFGDKTEKVEIEGPNEDANIVCEKLRARIEELHQTMATASVRVLTKYNGFIVGREGANIRRLKEAHNVQVSIKDAVGNQSDIVFEGDPNGVQRAAQEVREMVKRLDNEKIKDVIIEPRFQQLLRMSVQGVAPIRTLYDEYPSVTVQWPESLSAYKKSSGGSASAPHDPTLSVVHLQGQKQDVDAFAERLNKLLKQVKENNYHHEFRLHKESRNAVRDILRECDVRMQPIPAEDMPIAAGASPDSQGSSALMWLVGREKNVHEALDRIDVLQQKMANWRQTRLRLPSFIKSKVVGDSAPTLRAIREQCDGVSFKFPRGASNEVIISGPAPDVAKAELLVNQLNSKVDELCEEKVIPCDKKYHRYIIGKQGQNLAQYREKHGVELVLPERHEADPKVANEIRVIGSKTKIQAAASELQAQIKTLEDEVDVSVSVPTKFLRSVTQAKRLDPVLSRVRVQLPPRQADSEEKTAVSVKLSGPKAMVEAAHQKLTDLVADLACDYCKNVPLADKFIARSVNRLRSQMPEWEAEFHAVIRVTVEDDSGGHMDISGRRELVEALYEQKIAPNLPITEQFELPKDLHRNLLSFPAPPEDHPPSPQRGANNKSRGGRASAASAQDRRQPDHSAVNKVTDLQQRFGVFVKLPPQSQEANYVSLNGTPGQVMQAREQLQTWAAEWEAEKQDRIARSYEEEMAVAKRFVSQLLNRRAKYRQQFDVNLRIEETMHNHAATNGTHENGEEPAAATATEDKNGKSEAEEKQAEEEKVQGSTNGDADLEESFDVVPKDAPHALLSDEPVKVILRGYKEKVAECRKELVKLIEQLSSQVREALNIPQYVHGQLIGQRRMGLQRIQDEFKVQVEFPGREVKGDSAHTVIVMGDQAGVDAACDYIISRATELIDRYHEQGGPPQSREPTNNNNINNSSKANTRKKDFVVVGGPWDRPGRPNTDSQVDFPTMGGGATA